MADRNSWLTMMRGDHYGDVSFHERLGSKMALLQCAIAFVSAFSLLGAWQLIIGLIAHDWRGREVEDWREYEHGEGKAMYGILRCKGGTAELGGFVCQCISSHHVEDTS